MTAIVFRRLRSPSEHAAAGELLADGGVASAGPASRGIVLFGLEDLAVLNGEGLVGVAVTRPLDDAGSVEPVGSRSALATGARGWAVGWSPRWPTPCGSRAPPRCQAGARPWAGCDAAGAGRFTAAARGGGGPAGTGRGWRYLWL